jgi:hypothetical protein
MTTERDSRHTKALADVIREAIDKGTTRVENIHRSIADLPFKMLEDRKLLRAPAREVRRVQERAIRGVYDLIRTVNHQVGTLASDLRHELTKRAGAHADVSGTHRTGTHHS